ncbi:MAG: hypothetical protein LUG25_01370 [Oscillospiraceae bacterium]|nr:hypothetical protein [Oscillospiraceae bacterium]
MKCKQFFPEHHRIKQQVHLTKNRAPEKGAKAQGSFALLQRFPAEIGCQPPQTYLCGVVSCFALLRVQRIFSGIKHR